MFLRNSQCGLEEQSRCVAWPFLHLRTQVRRRAGSGAQIAGRDGKNPVAQGSQV